MEVSKAGSRGVLVFSDRSASIVRNEINAHFCVVDEEVVAVPRCCVITVRSCAQVCRLLKGKFYLLITNSIVLWTT